MAGRVYTIPASAPFADTLARGLIQRLGDAPLALADATIYLPTRRAQRTFGDAFARVLGGAALLPRFKALGDAEEDELLFDGDALDIPPAIAPMRRSLLLATLVQRWTQAGEGRTIGFAQAVALADSLAQVIDEIDTHGADLAALDAFVPAALAGHWEQVRRFLVLMRSEWPSLLASEGVIGHAERRDRVLTAIAQRLATSPPKGPVIAAGSTGSIPATARLMRAILDLPHGAVVLPGLDLELDGESWDALEPGHPQYGMRQLLLRLGIARDTVEIWHGAGDAPREFLLREVLRPAPTTDAWRAIAETGQAGRLRDGLDGLSLIDADDPVAEAEIIALALRDAVEMPGHRAALVTPDRTLARRVARELTRWSIEADDSAGRPLGHTLPGSFLCLLAEAAEADFAPVPLLALLKHPLCTFDLPRLTHLERVRALDLALRGPRPDDGLDGIKQAIVRYGRKHPDTLLQGWFASLAAVLAPFGAALAEARIDLAGSAARHLAAAEALAGTSLWRGEAGEVAANFIKDLLAATGNLPPIDRGAYAALFRRLAQDPAVRFQRSGHPRIAILGPLEARLQSFDTVVLGGLNEGNWPRSTGADPWLSRPMRDRAGLEQPERAIGQSAHDFAMLAAGPRVLLTRAQKADGAPAVASRWIQRLLQLAQGLDIADALDPATDYRQLAEARNAVGAPHPEGQPAPRPPVKDRPKKVSVTEVERWVRDPYAIYARRVLGLEVLKALDAPIGALERGNLFHKALEHFVKKTPGALPDDAVLQLIAAADAVFAAEGLPKDILALWRPRFIQAAGWFVGLEAARREQIAASHTEVSGELIIADDFLLYGVADRIDVMTDGRAEIIDYKTGMPPSPDQIEVFLTPQLPLEGAILAAGGFKNLPALAARELLYIRISGGREPGAVKPVPVALIEQAMAKLKSYIALFRMPETPYPSRPRAQFIRADGDYDHLARVREWSLSGVPDE